MSTFCFFDEMLQYLNTKVKSIKQNLIYLLSTEIYANVPGVWRKVSFKGSPDIFKTNITQFGHFNTQ